MIIDGKRSMDELRLDIKRAVALIDVIKEDVAKDKSPTASKYHFLISVIHSMIWEDCRELQKQGMTKAEVFKFRKLAAERLKAQADYIAYEDDFYNYDKHNLEKQ